jgi:hypothetical protein
MFSIWLVWLLQNTPNYGKEPNHRLKDESDGNIQLEADCYGGIQSTGLKTRTEQGLRKGKLRTTQKSLQVYPLIYPHSKLGPNPSQRVLG